MTPRVSAMADTETPGCMHAGRHGLGLELVAVPASSAVGLVVRDRLHVSIKRSQWTQGSDVRLGVSRWDRWTLMTLLRLWPAFNTDWVEMPYLR